MCPQRADASFCWSPVCRSPQENVSCEFILVSPAGPRMFRSSYENGFWDERQVAVQVLFCRLLPGLVQAILSSSFLDLGPVGWNSRIQRLYLCRGACLLQHVCWIWQETIWWWGSSNAGDLGDAVYLFIAIVFLTTLVRISGTWQGPIPDQIELNCVMTLNWFVWNYLFLHLTVDLC